MRIRNLFLIIIFSIFLKSCADYKNITKKEKQYYVSTGFALIYEDNLYKEKVINNKLNNESFQIMHRKLKKNTSIKIINPKTSKVFEGKIYKKTDYPNIFNIVITKKVASILELDENNPYIEIIETKKNKTFIAKESNIFDEEKEVADKAPVNDEINMDDLSVKNNDNNKNKVKEYTFTIIISDFYFADSAHNLKDDIIKKTQIDNINVKKINNTKYRLVAGPYKNFNALKNTYISLNNLGFENLNILNE